MLSIQTIIDELERIAPAALAEDWDNVGLLLGDAAAPIERTMTCLTITSASAAEAVERQSQLIIAHHPLPFRPLKAITTATIEGQLLWTLARHGIAVYSPHTAFDSARDGINRRLAEGLELTNIERLVPAAAEPTATDVGAARHGRLAKPLRLRELAARVRSFLKIDGLHLTGDPERTVSRVAVACGSAGEFLAPAREAQCECLITGEVRFHACLEAEATGMGLILAGHYATERFGVEHLAGMLRRAFPTLEVWASREESDPLRWLAG